jgi:hypothetical protein
MNPKQGSNAGEGSPQTAVAIVTTPAGHQIASNAVPPAVIVDEAPGPDAGSEYEDNDEDNDEDKGEDGEDDVADKERHAKVGYPNHAPCPHTCKGGKCAKEHRCKITNCTQQGRLLNQWTLSGGGLTTHRQSLMKHPHCSKKCPEYDRLGQKGRTRKGQEEKMGEASRSRESVKTTVTVKRKRGRQMVYSEDDEDDSNDSTTSEKRAKTRPSSLSPNQGLAMDVDAPANAEIADLTDRIRANAIADAQPTADSLLALQFNLLVVFDENGASSHRDIHDSTTWIKTSIETEHADKMLGDRALAKFIERYDHIEGEARPREGETTVMIYDRVSAHPHSRLERHGFSLFFFFVFVFVFFFPLSFPSSLTKQKQQNSSCSSTNSTLTRRSASHTSPGRIFETVSCAETKSSYLR